MGVTASIDISAEQRQLTLALFNKYLPNTQVWAFGSRVKWTTRSNSDLDLVAFSNPQQDPQISALKEAFEESNLPFSVDLLVWDNLPENFQRNIQECYVILVAGNDIRRDWVKRSGWKRLPVTEVCTLIVDCVNKTAPSVDYVTQYKMIRTPNIKNGRVDVNDCRYVEKDVFDKWTRRASVENDDVLLTREAPMGEVGIVNTKENVFLGQRIMQYRVDKKVMNPRFLLYSFLSNDLQNQFGAHEGSGSVVSHIRVPDCLKFEINVPPLDEQNWIVDVLGNIDDKIELNRQTNQTLEQIAQAIFKSWFVDFEPVKAKIAALNSLSLRERAGVRGKELAEQAAICAISGKTPEQLAQLDPQALQQLKTTATLFPDALVDSELGEIPEGWEVRQLSSIIHVIGGGTPTRSEETYWNGDIPWFSIKDIPASGDVFVIDTIEKISEQGLQKSSTKLLPTGTTIITARGTVGKLALVGTPMCMNQSCYGIRGIDGIGAYFNYFNLREAITTLQQNTHGAVFDTITTQTFDSYSMAICIGEITQKFEEMVEPLLEKIQSNVREAIILGKLRDSLLPKLLSGEINLANLKDPHRRLG